MRVLVTGGRDYHDEKRLYEVLDKLHAETPITLVIHGACCWRDGSLRGADGLAEKWAIVREVMYMGCPASWSAHGIAAGPKRNRGMLAFVPELVVAFPGGSGTADMVSAARAVGVRVVEG